MAGDTEFWTSHVEACRREGGAASGYARQHGLVRASLYYWRRKLTLAVGADPILTHRADRKMTQGGALRFRVAAVDKCAK